jgi:hypothetical protein
MLKRIATSLLVAVATYVLGAIAGGFLLDSLSANSHDRSVEAAMTGAFVFGPIAAAIGFLMTLRWTKG